MHTTSLSPRRYSASWVAVVHAWSANSLLVMPLQPFNMINGLGKLVTSWGILVGYLVSLLLGSRVQARDWSSVCRKLFPDAPGCTNHSPGNFSCYYVFSVLHALPLTEMLCSCEMNLPNRVVNTGIGPVHQEVGKNEASPISTHWPQALHGSRQCID